MRGKDDWSSAAGLIETSKRFLDLRKITGCDVNVTDEFVDIFGDDLKLDGHGGKPFAVGGLLSRELVDYA